MLAERILQNAFPLYYLRLLLYQKLPSCINICDIDNRNVLLIEWARRDTLIVERKKACIGQTKEEIIKLF